MATQRRQESLWWFECQRASLLQRSQSGEAGIEATSPKSEDRNRREAEEIFLREVCWANEDVAGGSEEP